ncbi:hypothetical protein APV28_4956 [Comamonas testosteroni]|nr:hypothetical protein APV28_4956 [Comamonas testosteroni]
MYAAAIAQYEQAAAVSPAKAMAPGHPTCVQHPCHTDMVL